MVLTLAPAMVMAQADGAPKDTPNAPSAYSGENIAPESNTEVDPEGPLPSPLLKHVASDQRDFWMAPRHFRRRDLQWAAPFLGTTAGFIAGDSWISKQVPPGKVHASNTFSDYATYSLVGAGSAAFLLGRFDGNDHLSEAGLLSGEAALNSSAITFLLKSITQRQRPSQANGSGTFFQQGGSFPSEHAAIAWSVASVLAHEYPGPLTKVLAYSLATGVSATRVTGKQHFASDVIVGSVLGWYFGRQVYRAHHDTDLGGAPWDSSLPERSEDGTRDPRNMASPYVPLDSWVYPAIERLAAMGYVKTAALGMRPWTRLECAQFLEEAESRMGDEERPNGAALRITDDLSHEFAGETARLNGAANLGASLDALYTRALSISGPPLRDGYHFGETITNDYGRPYERGLNSVDGVIAHAQAGPVAFLVRGEYQHAPAAPAHAPAILQAIAGGDFTSPVSDARPEVNRFELVEGAVSLTHGNVQLSLGKLSQWLGPGESGALLMSNNASAIRMVKLETVSPYEIPLLSRFMGPVRTEYFLGQLSGHQFEFTGTQLLGPGGITPQPFIDGGKFTFSPSANLTVGVGFTALFAGPGLPFTFSNFARTFYVHTDSGATTTRHNPAKRTSTIDFIYRIPRLRNWLTIYSDAMTVDEISPLGSTRATVNPGVYVPQFPRLHNLEFRAEGLHEPLTREFAPGFVYYGLRRYRSGYTNDGDLMGNWIGRAGRGGQAWLTYSWSPRTRFQFSYRLQEVSRQFLEGGRAADYSISADVAIRPALALQAFAQYEQWSFPLLAPTRQADTSIGIQFTFFPHAPHRR
ncbi:MAG TPA: capsule assembly Wzi family protein [Terriglobales bacterium]